MQLRLVEGENDLRKSDVVGVTVVFRVGEDYDMVFRKRRHGLVWIIADGKKHYLCR